MIRALKSRNISTIEDITVHVHGDHHHQQLPHYEAGKVNQSCFNSQNPVTTIITKNLVIQVQSHSMTASWEEGSLRTCTEDVKIKAAGLWVFTCGPSSQRGTAMGVYTLTQPICSTTNQPQLPNFVCSLFFTIIKDRSNMRCSFRCLHLDPAYLHSLEKVHQQLRER